MIPADEMIPTNSDDMKQLAWEVTMTILTYHRMKNFI